MDRLSNYTKPQGINYQGNYGTAFLFQGEVTNNITYKGIALHIADRYLNGIYRFYVNIDCSENFEFEHNVDLNSYNNSFPPMLVKTTTWEEFN